MCIILGILFTIYWLISGGVLWWSYDITPLIRGGYYHIRQALSLVAEMGLILTALTTTAWLWGRCKMAWSSCRLIWKEGWRTLLLLTIYSGAVLARLQFGHVRVARLSIPADSGTCQFPISFPKQGGLPSCST